MTFSNKSVAINQDSTDSPPKEDKVEVKEDDREKEDKEETEEPKEDKKTEDQPVVSTTAGDGFFDDFVSNSNEEEGTRGRGER